MCMPNEDELRKKNLAGIDEFFQNKEQSVDEFLALFTEDAVWELPWTEPVQRWAGKASLRERLETTSKHVQEWKWMNSRISPTLDPNRFFVEIEAIGAFIQPGGSILRPNSPNRYIFTIVLEDGRIKYLGEHFDRLFAMKALGMPASEYRSPRTGRV
jgi:ketosteroid isomerase-like protein